MMVYDCTTKISGRYVNFFNYEYQNTPNRTLKLIFYVRKWFFWYQQGKSEGFGSCDQPSNFA